MIGAWRSLVAHLHGVQGVGGSNPLAPTYLGSTDSCLSSVLPLDQDCAEFSRRWGCIVGKLIGQYSLGMSLTYESGRGAAW